MRLVPLFAFLAVLVLSSAWLPAVDPQIEFTGELEDIDDSSDLTVLRLRLTPTFSIPVQVTERTEIREEHGESITVADLEIGQQLEVKGLFTVQGILALEVSVADGVAEFEIRGRIEQIGEGRRIELLGLSIRVPESTVIKDQFGNLLTFTELAVGLFVRIEGRVEEGELVALEITVRTLRDEFATVRFRGVIAEVLGPEAFILLLEGGVPVQVVITTETEIHGELAVGVSVKVAGRLRPDLAVEAHRITVERLLQLAPARLQMRPDQRRRVVVILRSPLDLDVELSLESADPEIATASPEVLVVPAGRVTSFFDVMSGGHPGETSIAVSMPASLGALTVDLPVIVRGEDEEEQEGDLELEWQPKRLSASPPGNHRVRVQLNRPAPADLVVSLQLSEGPADLLDFPAEVMIRRGERVAVVPISILSSRVSARIRATLPPDVGGDSADLEIQPAREPVRLGLRWVPDEVETEVGEEFQVRLVLDQPAPDELTVFIGPHGGGQTGALGGVPSEVRFEPGHQEMELTFRALAPGKVRLRASLPFRVGGRHDDLRVEVDR